MLQFLEVIWRFSCNLFPENACNVLYLSLPTSLFARTFFKLALDAKVSKKGNKKMKNH